MTTLTLTDDLTLNHPQMDATHREFFELLARLDAVKAAEVDAILPELEAFEAHTRAHFAQEEAWMLKLGFQADTCHFQQHAAVLQLLTAVKRRVGEEGQVDWVKELVPALVEWFVPHAKNMDGGLAQVMTAAGFDPETGTAVHAVKFGGESGGQAVCASC
jgi:hemerythrin